VYCLTYEHLNQKGDRISHRERSDASLEDLDNALTDTHLERLCQIQPRAGFLESGKEEILLQLRIAVQDGGAIRPTLAGLLMFGKYPQEFVPQLMITFVRYLGPRVAISRRYQRR